MAPRLGCRIGRGRASARMPLWRAGESLEEGPVSGRQLWRLRHLAPEVDLEDGLFRLPQIDFRALCRLRQVDPGLIPGLPQADRH